MTEPRGPASYSDIQLLHGTFVRELTKAVNDDPSCAVLAVTRAFLRDQGLLGLAHDEAGRKKLQRMYTLLVRRLLEVLEGPELPSAAHLQIVRQFLDSNGVSKDLQEGVTRAQALKALADAWVPFKGQPH